MQNTPDLEKLILHIDGCSTVQTVALRRAIFKQKKGFATIILGLITAIWAHLNYYLVTLSL
jgi:hypothetical protein